MIPILGFISSPRCKRHALPGPGEGGCVHLLVVAVDEPLIIEVILECGEAGDHFTRLHQGVLEGAKPEDGLPLAAFHHCPLALPVFVRCDGCKGLPIHPATLLLAYTIHLEANGAAGSKDAMDLGRVERGLFGSKRLRLLRGGRVPLVALADVLG